MTRLVNSQNNLSKTINQIQRKHSKTKIVVGRKSPTEDDAWGTRTASKRFPEADKHKKAPTTSEVHFVY
jgi:hypothetical protein